MLKLLISTALAMLVIAITTLLFNWPLQAPPAATRRVLLTLCIGCVAAGLLAMVLFWS